MAEPLACAQCGARGGRTAPGWAGRQSAPVRDCATAERRRAGLAVACAQCGRPTAERAGLGWLALAPVRTAQRRRAMAEPLACAQCGASGGRTVPGRAGRHLRRYATALRPSAPDWDGWHLLRYGLRSGGGLWPSRLLAPSAVRAAAEQCLAGQADTCADTRLPYGRARRTGMAGTCSGTDCAAAEGYGPRPRSRAVQPAWRPNGACRVAAGPGCGLQNGPR